MLSTTLKERGKYLKFPWDEGFTAEDVEKYYDKIEFKDWTHKLSKAKMLKAQHPGYELSKMGIHGKRGVACADCHMPYKTEGGKKYSDHHVRSPLTNVANACQQCHRQSENELLENVASLKRKAKEMAKNVEVELVRAHVEAAKAWEVGATEAQMKKPLTHIRHGQWRWDYAVASHGAYFHAPEEVLRTLGSALKEAAAARLELRKVLYANNFKGDVPYPPIKTKADAQKFIGFDYAKAKAAKKAFLNGYGKEQWDEAPTMDMPLKSTFEKYLDR